MQVSSIPETGYVRSEPGYLASTTAAAAASASASVSDLDARFQHGSDYLRIDPDGTHTRLDVDSLVRDEGTGALVRYRYSGVIDMRGEAGKVLRGEPDCKTTGFGDTCEFAV